MTTVLGGLIGTVSYIGFGNNVTGVSLLGGAIDTTALDNLAFSVPRDGFITSISAFLSTTAALTLLGTTVTVTAQLFSATGDNIFTPIPGAAVALAPPFTNIIAIGTVSEGLIEGLSIPVVAGQRLLMVFSAEVTAGLDIATAITGYASAGVAIS
ncbi:hypothetical protein BTS2_3999 [Bacillus sp. TS-2]|nr:hypothetical protein BTS2_3999 [Bacillus sp. TS-2]